MQALTFLFRLHFGNEMALHKKNQGNKALNENQIFASIREKASSQNANDLENSTYVIQCHLME